MQHHSTSIEALIKRGQLEAAFHRLVDEDSRFLLRAIQRWVRDEQFAEDVLQNTFIKIWKGLPEFRGDAQVRSWCFRIAYNESMGFLRSSQRFKLVDFEAHHQERQAEATGWSGSEIESLLHQALEGLPDRQRQVFELRYYEEMSYEEIAEILQLSVGSLKASFHHARKKIEESLKRMT